MRDNDPDGGSKRNVAYHYDLGNDFYELWLDDTMTYSAAFTDDASVPASDADLERAQRRKWDRILDLIQPGPQDHILEIGCGWGGFAIHAAQDAGCRVTGITLSEQQLEMARERVAAAGLEGRVDLRLQDYREVPGTFTGIASIEMFEAVGERWWRPFFRRTRELLEPGRAAAMQVITIAEDRFEGYRRRPDFMQRYVFPGGMLPSPERFREAAEVGGLSVREPSFFGMDYARTLTAWSERFERALPEVRALGFDDRFVRMWRYYLAYCRTGFEHGTIDVMQVRLDG
jgi:cyclopropane-fatty-acyl-phospholipid synthase